MKNKNLFVFEDSSQCHYGGGQKVTLETLNILKEYYSEIYVFDYSDNSIFIKKCREYNFKTIKLKPLKNSLILLNFIFNILKVLQTISLKKCDYYICTKIGLVYSPILSFFGKVVYHVHNIEKEKSLSLFFMNLLVFSDSVICVSNSVKYRLPTFIQRLKRTKVVYNFHKNSKLDNKELNRKKTVIHSPDNFVFLGSLEHIKGVDIAINAFLKSNSIKKQSKLIICGVGGEQKRLKSLANNDHRIVFKGFVEDISKFLDENSVLILPTRICEACPMSIIESIFRDVPIITSNIGGQAELVKISNYGILFNNESIDSCKLAMEKIQDQRSYNELLINNKTEEFRSIFSYENYVAAMIEEFK